MRYHHWPATTSGLDAPQEGRLATQALASRPQKTDPHEGLDVPAPGSGGEQARASVRSLLLVGKLNRHTAHTLELEIETLCESGAHEIQLDLSGLESIDRTGVMVIAFRSKLCQRRGFVFTLLPGAQSIQREFDACGVGDSLPFAKARTAGGDGDAALAAAANGRGASIREVVLKRRSRS